MKRIVREVSGPNVPCAVAVGEEGGRAGLGHGAVDGEHERLFVGDRVQHALLDAHAQDAAVAIDDGDDRLLAGADGRRAASAAARTSAARKLREAGSRLEQRRRDRPASWTARSGVNVDDAASAAVAGRDDYFRAAVAIEIGRRRPHATGIRAAEDEAAGEDRRCPAIEDAHMCGPPPAPGPVTMSTWLSALASPAATKTPPLNVGE